MTLSTINFSISMSSSGEVVTNWWSLSETRITLFLRLLSSFAITSLCPYLVKALRAFSKRIDSSVSNCWRLIIIGFKKRTKLTLKEMIKAFGTQNLTKGRNTLGTSSKWTCSGPAFDWILWKACEQTIS